MKKCLSIIALGLGFIAAGTRVSAQGLTVTLKVAVLSDTETKTKGASSKGRGAGTPEQTIQQNKSLEIILANAGQHDLSNLTIVYYIFAKDVHSKEISLAKKGQQTTDVKSLAKVTLNTESAILASHSAHSKTVDGRTESTAAGGAKYYGYGVQVLSGNRVVAENYDPPELKSSISLPETPPPDATAKGKKKSTG